MPLQPHTHRASATRGFTLIELVFVLIVISVMAAILIPGLLAATSKARRIRCANSMYQVSLALQNYHDTYGTLPPAWICDQRDQEDPQWGWNTLLLGNLEQSALYDAIQPGPNPITALFNLGPTGTDWLSTRVSTFECSAGQTDDRHPSRRFGRDVDAPRGWKAPVTNYVANVGFFCRSADYRNHGVMFGNSRVPLHDIPDGTSSTFLFGERDSLGGGATWIGVADPQAPDADGFGWVGGIVSVPMNCPTIEGCRDQGFASQHPGGSQFAFCDGSIRFISETVDFTNGPANRFDSTSDTLLTEAEKSQLGVYQQLGIRNDNRPILETP